MRDLFSHTVFQRLAPVAIALALAATAPAGRAQSRPAQAVNPAAIGKELDSFIAKGMADWRIPGLAIVVVTADGVAYEKGFGVRELGKPGKVDPHTMFGIASNTKAMTALAAAMLVDEGKLAWDAPLIAYLPGLRLPDAYLTEHVTLRDALRHSSGVADADPLWLRRNMTAQQMLARLDRVPATAALRSDFVYNNVMYQVVGEVIAAVSGMPWDRFVASRILAPLGMKETLTAMPALAPGGAANISSPHLPIDGQPRVIHDFPSSIIPAAGDVWSNAHDAAKWLAFLLSGGMADGKRLVSEASFKELMSPQFAIPKAVWQYPTVALTHTHVTAYGLGWFLQDYRGQQVAMHTGSDTGRIAMAGLIPDAKVGVFILGNLDHAEFRHALMWKVLDLATGAPARDWNGEALKLYGDIDRAAAAKQAAEDAKRVSGTQSSHPLAAYAGTYRHPAWGDVKVTLEDGALVFSSGPSPDLGGVLEHWHYDTFRTRLIADGASWALYGFGMDSDGSIASLTFGGAVYVRVATGD
jgi:CubicO group peptidase (beta-lactamase class C family)